MDAVLTKACNLCGASFQPEGRQRHCANCGTLSGEAYKAVAQLRKAQKLAITLARHGIDAEDAAAAPEGFTRLAAEQAGVTEPSDVTWAMTVALLRGGEGDED